MGDDRLVAVYRFSNGYEIDADVYECLRTMMTMAAAGDLDGIAKQWERLGVLIDVALERTQT